MNTWFSWRLSAFSRVALTCISVILSPAATAGSTPQGSTPAALYQSYCSVCHGDQGNGQSRARASLNPPPVDFTQAGLRATLTRERMILGVREGRPGTAMVGWKTQLNDAQIASVVDYVRDKFMERAEPPTKVPAKPPTAAPSGAAAAVANARPAPVPALLKGDKTLGGTLYDNNCVACHGKAGDGNGPRAYFISPKPRSFVSAESRAVFTRPVLVNSIAQGKRGTEMPSWDKVLSAQEIANIAEYVFQQFISTDSTTGTSARK